MLENYKLLIVDDEPWNYKNIENLLDWKALKIELLEIVTNGEMALESISINKPDIVLTDINMPVMGGLELIKILKDKYPLIEVLVLSGYNDFKFVREALVLGAVDYLLKPVKRNGLLDVLDKAKTKIEYRNINVEKLNIASSLILDGEYSQLLRGRNSETTLLEELELEYSMFTFVLVSIPELRDFAKDRNIPTEEATFRGKKIISDLIGCNKIILFNNTYLKGEFILICKRDTEFVQSISPKLCKNLKNYFSTKIRVYISDTQFSFKKFEQLYTESKFALSLVKISPVVTSSVYTFKNSRDFKLNKRVTREIERELLLALQSKNKNFVQDIIFKKVKLNEEDLKNWFVIEIRQTVDILMKIFVQAFNSDYDTLIIIENFRYPLNKALVKEDIKELISLFCQILDEFLPQNYEETGVHSMNNTIKDICDYIENNYFKNITLSTISEMFSVEKSYLCRNFKSYTKDNLMNYIAKIRISKAKFYIKKSFCNKEPKFQKNYNLTEIADLVGYEEYSYFNRVFRKIEGISPSEFRDSIKSGVLNV